MKRDIDTWPGVGEDRRADIRDHLAPLHMLRPASTIASFEPILDMAEAHDVQDGRNEEEAQRDPAAPNCC